MKILVIALLAAVAAIGANFALLGYANDNSDPVGNLTPRVSLPDPTTSTATSTESSTTERTTTTTTEVRTDTSDDNGGGGGSGRNRGRDHPEDD
jgi:hypothetical protein